jgi:cell division septation protein DedD
MADQDEEVKQGTGRLLGLFFGLVIVCALFFSLGYSLGRRSVPQPVAAASTTAPVNMGAEAKPSPARAEAASKPDCATPGACPETAPKSTTEDLTFYKAVEQNQPKAKLEPPAPPVAARVTTRTVESKPITLEMHRPATLGAGYMVQVAAVSKQEDAEALAQALRKKNYPVITINGPNDKFYHVQVGPFADMKDAEATRNKLIGDGYNPILKK